MSNQIFKGKLEAQLNESATNGTVLDLQISLKDMGVEFQYEKTETGHFFSVDVPNIDILKRLAIVFESKIIAC